jgi:WD40 repeat protein
MRPTKIPNQNKRNQLWSLLRTTVPACLTSLIFCFILEQKKKVHARTSHREIVFTQWDKTVMVWDLQSMSSVGKLVGHEQAVWDVLPAEDDAILTASADRTIKLWRGGACVHTVRKLIDSLESALKPLVHLIIKP